MTTIWAPQMLIDTGLIIVSRPFSEHTHLHTHAYSNTYRGQAGNKGVECDRGKA